MNQGKRNIRNTVIALYGAVVLFIGANSLYVAKLDTAPSWLRSTLSLGLTAHAKSQPRPELTDVDLASLRDFSRLIVEGDITVEIVGADAYKVTFTTPGSNRLRAWHNGDVLRVEAESGGAAGATVLRIEMPELKSLYIKDAKQLILRDVRSAELNVIATNVRAASLQQNRVARWKFYSSEPLEALVDKATLTAGSMQTTGNLTIRYGEVP